VDQPSLHSVNGMRDRVLRAFVRADGRIERLPAKASKRLLVLDYVAQAFEIGHRYPEREVNATLLRYHDDYASLRRNLVDAGFLERDNGVYWRSGGTVEV
jgi:hypothetical protein